MPVVVVSFLISPLWVFSRYSRLRASRRSAESRRTEPSNSPPPSATRDLAQEDRRPRFWVGQGCGSLCAGIADELAPGIEMKRPEERPTLLVHASRRDVISGKGSPSRAGGHGQHHPARHGNPRLAPEGGRVSEPRGEGKETKIAVK